MEPLVGPADDKPRPRRSFARRICALVKHTVDLYWPLASELADRAAPGLASAGGDEWWKTAFEDSLGAPLDLPLGINAI